MKPFGANLKTFYQCRGLWLWHFFFLVIAVPTLVRPLHHPEAGKGFFCGFMLVTFWTGITAASMAKGILVKPLSFCLPGHGRTARSVLLFAGGVVGALCALTLLAYPGDGPEAALLLVWNAFVLGAVFYLAGVFALLLMRNPGALPVCLIVLGFLMFHDSMTDLRSAL